MPQQQVVEPDDLRPVGRGRFRGPGVDGSDCRLHRIRAHAAGVERAADQPRAFRDLGLVPERSVLVIEQDHFSLGGDAGRPPRVVQQHQREQAEGFGLRQQLHQQAAEPNRFCREIVPRQIRT